MPLVVAVVAPDVVVVPPAVEVVAVEVVAMVEVVVPLPVEPPPLVLANVTDTGDDICALVLPAASCAIVRNQVVVPGVTPTTTDHCPFPATTAEPRSVPPVVAVEFENPYTNTEVPDSPPEPETVTN